MQLPAEEGAASEGQGVRARSRQEEGGERLEDRGDKEGDILTEEGAKEDRATDTAEGAVRRAEPRSVRSPARDTRARS